MAEFRKKRRGSVKQSTDVRFSDRGFAFAELGHTGQIIGLVPHYTTIDRPPLPDCPPGVLIYNLDMGCLQLSDPEHDEWLNICGLPYNAGIVAGSGLLGYPTDGTYIDGAIALNPSGTVADAIDELNEFLVQQHIIVYASHLGQTDGQGDGRLVSPNFTPGRVASPSTPGVPYYTDSWDNDTNRSLTNQLTLSYQLNTGEKITDLQEGTITAIYYNGNGTVIQTETLNPNGTISNQASLPNGNIQISQLENYGTRIQGFISVSIPTAALLASGSGYLRVEVQQVVGANVYIQDPLLFFKDSGNTPAIAAQLVTLKSGSPIKFLSGVKFAAISGASVPQLTFALSGSNIWRDAYRSDPLIRESTQFGIPNEVITYNDNNVTKAGLTPPVAPYIFNQDFVYNEDKDVGLNILNPDENGVYKTIRFTLRDPFNQTVGSYIGLSPTALINTMAAHSTDNLELFYDEDYRLEASSESTGEMISISGLGRGSDAWDSTLSLITRSALQVFNGTLIYPHQDFSSTAPAPNPNYISLAGGVGNLVYRRRFRQHLGEARSNGILKIDGLSEADRLAGNILIELRVVGTHVPGNGIQDIGNEGTGWLSLNAGFNSALFQGDDGDGCFVTTHGYSAPNFEFTLGGFSTAFADNQAIEVRVTFKDPAALSKKLTRIEITDWA